MTLNSLLSISIPHCNSEVTCTISKIEQEKLIALANVQSLAFICNKIGSEIPTEFNEYYQTILAEVFCWMDCS